MSDEHPKTRPVTPVTPIGVPSRWTNRPDYPTPGVDHGRLSLEDVADLVECASGADEAAITVLEGVVADLRRAAAARAELAAHVPPLMLKQVLLARAAYTADTADTSDTGPDPTAGTTAVERDPHGERS